MDNLLNQENKLSKEFNEEVTKTLKIQSVAQDSTRNFKKFFALGASGVLGVGVLSMLPASPLDHYMPIFSAALGLPTYYGIKGMITSAIAKNSEKNLLASHKEFSTKLSEIRDKSNNIEIANTSPKI